MTSAGPQIELSGGAVLVVAGLLVGGVVAYQAYQKSKSLLDGAGAAISGAASTLGGWVNPASEQNLAYQGVNAVGAAITDQPDWSLGGAVYQTQQERGFTNPLQIFMPSSAGVIAKELGDFFGWGSEPAQPAQKGVTGTW